MYKGYDKFLIEELKDPKLAKAYLETAIEEFLEDHDNAVFLKALRAITEAQGGVLKLARKCHLNRQNLYKALSPRGNPKLDTIGNIIKGLGFKISVEIDDTNKQGKSVN